MKVIETRSLGKSYGQTRALHDCTLAIPDWHVVVLVGTNGAGKTTLMALTVGLVPPKRGGVTVLGRHPAGSLAALDGIAFVAENAPLYRNLSAADLLHETRNLNHHFDQSYAERRLEPDWDPSVKARPVQPPPDQGSMTVTNRVHLSPRPPVRKLYRRPAVGIVALPRFSVPRPAPQHLDRLDEAEPSAEGQAWSVRIGPQRASEGIAGLDRHDHDQVVA